ncbi:HoxN/HupN/NixA family nickel/cobalt transporter [Enhydrobacter sp.]|jgi:high-affinity nickel-transport protein|uniref:HoxN/HupN/NixA family nickel/cobalt transporter n=1 Tax=Enhydrobacter sp. TaxID=1894999 RepID=UPI00260E11DC|nr:HoxN/HupN/NixA family nickel/cobalt transporter [Enhydrobacter sp.]WIM12745.1 MAG: HoxN/HupN/NixA family nickel/cobalt transporter [Enhydrobacter sp.]
MSIPGVARSTEKHHLRPRLLALYAVLIAVNLVAWAWALLAFRDHPALLGVALLACGFGLRHAVDADHIAAIDNVTRKLMQTGQRPLLVGFFFALGHSTVVALAAAAVAATATLIARHFEAFHEIGSLIGTAVSTLFLFAIAAINLAILLAVWRTFRHVRRGGRYVEEDFDLLLNSRGLLARLFRPLFRLITRSWHMFPLGFLFGLGFDTATEVSLLGIAASESAKGLSLWSMLVFPALFAAGMTPVDTTDGVLMLGAYQWAFVNPLRKLYYNLVITLVSVVVAVLIGTIELLGLLADRFGLDGAFWSAAQAAGAHLNELGLALVALLVATWTGSVAIWRYKRLDEAAPERRS